MNKDHKNYRILTDEEMERMEEMFNYKKHKIPLKESIMFEIKYFFDNLRSKWYSFKYGIKNLIDWFPLIWRNRWYDYTFLMELNRKQLRHMEEHWPWSHYIGWEKEHQKIKELLEILEEIDAMEDTLDENADKKYEEFGKKLYGITEKKEEGRIKRASQIRFFWD